MAGIPLTGLIAPPYTPMHADGGVNLEAVEDYAELLIQSGVSGLFVNGSTGESMSLSTAERLELAARWRGAVGPALPVVIHAGTTCVGDCQLMAEHAQSIGADAVAAMGPCFFRPTRVEDLVEFCAQVAAAAPGLPFYYYHVPVLTNVRLDMVEFLSLASERIPTLAGAKFSEPDLDMLGRCVRLAGGRHNILFGCEDILLAGLAFGARGSIGTSFNFAAPLFLRLMDAFEAGDLEAARAEQERVADLMAVLERFGALVAGKAAMGMIGVDCGSPRPPLRDLTEGRRRELRSELERIGFFDYCSGRSA